MKTLPATLPGLLCCCLSLILLPGNSQAGNEVGFEELFALSADREAALKQLVPGTEEYYYYHALHAQNQGRHDEVETLLKTWLERYEHADGTPRYREIRNRALLLSYDRDPLGALERLRLELGLQFLHEQDRPDAKPQLPTILDPALVDRDAFLRQALQDVNSLSAVSDRGLDALLRSDVAFNPSQRRELLSRIRQPDYPRLVGLVAAELRAKTSQGFGEFPIHTLLLPEQLDQLVAAVPSLAASEAFVQLRIRQMHPNGDTDWSLDPTVRGAYLESVWNYVRTLPPAFVSLQAHALFQLLDHHRRLGEHPRELFLEYLKLPRQAAYANPAYLKGNDPRFYADLSKDFSGITHCPAVGNDEPLLREYFLTFFEQEDSWESYATWVSDTWLKPVFAEAKLIRGVGDAARWFSLLSPSAVQALKDRVDLVFPVSNRTEFSPDDEVTLQLEVKNVPRLMVKVYELNPLNYYLDRAEEITTALDLDGLTANEEQTHDYTEAPVRQVRRAFTFPGLKGKRGVWIVEFIGNGISSRALVRKGRLQYLAANTSAGVAVRVLDEANRPAAGPSIWFGGHRHTPKEGSDEIVLPFSTQPGPQPVVLMAGDFASLEQIEVPGENYTLEAGFHVERETLLSGQQALLVVRPKLFVNGQPAPTGLIEEVRLRMTSTDLEGVTSTVDVPGFSLNDEKESVQPFRVPERVVSLSFSLEGKISRLSEGGESKSISAGSATFALNTIDRSDQTAALHLSKMDGQWVLEVLGKNGEPLANRAVTIQTHHEEFQFERGFSLQTDTKGRIELGKLPGMDQVRAAAQGLQERVWSLQEENHTYGGTIHGLAGTPVLVPLMVQGRDTLRASDLAVFEVRQGTNVRDVFPSIRFADGIALLEGLTPGDYELWLRGPGRRITLRITEGSAAEGYLLSRHRHLEITNPAPLQIASILPEGDLVRIQLRNADPFTRVHIAATRFLPEFGLFTDLADPNRSNPILVQRGIPETQYVSGRDIGEEYRYILERRAARKFPGNLLQAPSLLLNPWALADTRTEVAEAAAGEVYDAKEVSRPSNRAPADLAVEKQKAQMAAEILRVNLNFLRQGAPVAYNLKPDANGIITLKRTDLGDRQQLHVLAVNATDAVERQLSLPEGKGVVLRDLRLTNSLDSQRHYTQQRKVTFLDKGGKLVIPDLRGSDLETYDTLAAVASVLSGINTSADFREFSFLLDWPTLKEERKRELYSRYACHEMHFFLSRKDPEFFQRVVLPYLKNKKDRTFFDDYLTGADLKHHTSAWAYGRLNTVERILLAARLGGSEPAAVARQIRDRLALQPRNVDQDSVWFFRALDGRRLNEAADFAFKSGEALGRSGDGDKSQIVLDASGFASGGAMGALKADLPAASTAPAPAAPMAEELAKNLDSLSALSEVRMRRSLGVEALKQELADRELNRALFRPLESTREWAENNYWHLPLDQQIPDLITENAFWRDYATWDGKGGFTSREFPAASRSFAEMWLSLAVMDLPFTSGKHDLTIEDNTLTFTAGSPLLAFHEEIEETPIDAQGVPVLVNQSFFRASERYQMIDGEQADKPVPQEYLTGVLYGAQVVVTNPGSSTQKLEVLLQVPQGSVPAQGSDYTRTFPVRLQPYATHKLEYFFYFPRPSEEAEGFRHYPVQVAKESRVVAFSEPFRFRVVNQLGTVDKTSWEYLSQSGTDAQVIDFLNLNNIEGLDLSRIAWRVRKSPDFLRQVAGLLDKRHRYDGTIWSYGLLHNVLPLAREYLRHRGDFLDQCGSWLECSLVSLDTLDRGSYQHLEYFPLVNARSHQLGRDRRILNDRFLAQYQATMHRLIYRPEFSDIEEATVAYYLFLQDRVAEGLDWLERVRPGNVTTGLQLDYLQAYAALYREDLDTADQIAARHAAEPVDRWRDRFAQVSAQIKEIRGEALTVADPKDRGQQQEALAATEPQFLVETKEGKVRIDYHHLGQIRVNYYEMDLEFLFSSNPFVSQGGQRFSYLRPNMTEVKDLAADRNILEFPVPPRFASRNVLVEIVGGGQRKYTAVYANSLKVETTDAYGLVQVRHAGTGKPLPRVYVKVYARQQDGVVRFYKDGYTDLRGKFDYTSLSTNDLDNTERLSLLIMSENDGAVVREVTPPQR